MIYDRSARADVICLFQIKIACESLRVYIYEKPINRSVREYRLMINIFLTILTRIERSVAIGDVTNKTQRYDSSESWNCSYRFSRCFSRKFACHRILMRNRRARYFPQSAYRAVFRINACGKENKKSVRYASKYTLYKV